MKHPLRFPMFSRPAFLSVISRSVPGCLATFWPVSVLLTAVWLTSCCDKGQVLASDKMDNPGTFAEWLLEADTTSCGCLTPVLSVHDGAFHLQVPKGATLWYRTPFEGNVRITFEACIVCDGCAYDRLSDLNCFWMASDPQHPDDLTARSDERQGIFLNYYQMDMYYVGYGGNRNTTTRFRRYHGDDAAVTDPALRPAILTEYTDAPHLLEANRWYSFVIEVQDGTTRYWRDGELLVDYTDPEPLKRGWFGLRTTQAHAAWRRFQVTRL